MIIEFQLIDETLSNKDIRSIIEEVNKKNLKKVAALPCHIPIIKKYLSNTIKLSSIIDFPFGILSTSTRSLLVKQSIDHGADSIEILCPSYMIVNKLYAALKQDISDIYNICIDKQIDLSYILEYRTYTYDSLYKICKILLECNINSVYISTGYKIDDIYDHLIAMTMIQKKIPNIQIIPNSNIFNKNHINLINSANISKIRVSSLNSADLF